MQHRWSCRRAHRTARRFRPHVFATDRVVGAVEHLGRKASWAKRKVAVCIECVDSKRRRKIHVAFGTLLGEVDDI